jgi:hypothetical protein
MIIALLIGFAVGWAGCSLVIAGNRDDYVRKIAFLKKEINNLTKGEVK